jgi:integrase
MASYRKLPSGLWFAEVFKLGVRRSLAHTTKAKAIAWATQLEAEIMARKRGQIVNRTLRQCFERYADEVSPTKKNKRWEAIRIRFLTSPDTGLPFVDKMADDVTADDLARWRDDRLKYLKGSTINRDLNLISAVFSVARDEWGWCSQSPTRLLRRPPDPKPRDRLIHWREIRSVLRALDWHMREPVTLQQEAGFAFLMSLHTAMRASEVLKARYVNGVAELDDTKNGQARRVPLSARAQRLLKHCPGFTITGPSLDALFRKARQRAGLSGFTFHDARATALTRMARRVDVFQLAKISGHKDVSILSNVYYRESAESIGSRLR